MILTLLVLFSTPFTLSIDAARVCLGIEIQSSGSFDEEGARVQAAVVDVLFLPLPVRFFLIGCYVFF